MNKPKPEPLPIKHLTSTDLPGYGGVAEVILDDAPHNPSASGFGPKVATDTKLTLHTLTGLRTFRVYRAQSDNAGTPYVVLSRRPYYLTPEVEAQIAEARAAL